MTAPQKKGDEQVGRRHRTSGSLPSGTRWVPSGRVNASGRPDARPGIAIRIPALRRFSPGWRIDRRFRDEARMPIFICSSVELAFRTRRLRKPPDSAPHTIRGTPSSSKRPTARSEVPLPVSNRRQSEPKAAAACPYAHFGAIRINSRPQTERPMTMRSAWRRNRCGRVDRRGVPHLLGLAASVRKPRRRRVTHRLAPSRLTQTV